MKNTLFSILAIGFIALSAGCSKSSNNAPPTTANVMFFDGCAGTTNVDVSANGTKIGAASSLAFLKNSSYQPVTQGNDSFSFVLTNLGTPLKSGTFSLVAGTSYSIFTGGLITGATILSIADDLTAPTAGNCKIRFVNLSTDAMSVTANVGNTAIATAITSQGFSSFSQVAAGSYTIKAGDPANINTVISVGPQQLSAGSIYTIVLTGTLTGTGVSALTLTLITNH
jgi:hypothetical protein